MALTPRNKLSVKGLLSIKLDDVTWDIMVAQRENVVKPKCDARAVVTRGQAKKLQTERLQEEKQLLKDNPEPTGLRKSLVRY